MSASVQCKFDVNKCKRYYVMKLIENYDLNACKEILKFCFNNEFCDNLAQLHC